jgi:Ni/Co efflux regulator RcnB
MKRIVSTALAVSMLATTALAQPQGGDRGGRGEGGQRQAPRDGGGDRGARPQGEQPQPQVQQPDRGPQPGPGSYLRSGGRRDANSGDPQARPRPEQQQPQQQRPQQRDPNDGRDVRIPDNRNNGAWRNDRNWQNNPGWQNDRYNGGYRGQPPQQFRDRDRDRDRDRGRQQFDQRRYQPSYRAPQRFRASPYRAPQGFYFRSWSYGDRLPFGWYTPSYYLSWGAYGLPIPPVGCEWVRVGQDAVLIDVWSGEVLSVYHGLFW